MKPIHFLSLLGIIAFVGLTIAAVFPDPTLNLYTGNFQGNGGGLSNVTATGTQTNIAVSGVTNAGTAAYSNANSFDLSGTALAATSGVVRAAGYLLSGASVTNLLSSQGLTDTNFSTGSYTTIRGGWFVATNFQTGNYIYSTNGAILLTNLNGSAILLSNGVVSFTNSATGLYGYISNGGAWFSSNVVANTFYGTLSGNATTATTSTTANALAASASLTLAQVSNSIPSQITNFAKAYASNIVSGGLLPSAAIGTGSANSSTFARGDGTWATPSGGTAIPTTVTSTNFVLNTVYTNTSGTAQIIDATVALQTAAILGTADIDLYADQLGGTAFVLQDRSAVGTLVTSIAMAYTNNLSGILTNLATYFFTNASTGAGNSSSIVPGTGQITTLGNVFAAGIVSAGTTITVNGTPGQITSSAGAQDLSANRVWTLALAAILTNAIDSTNVTITGGVRYGDRFRTNGLFVDNTGELFTNNLGSVKISGGNVVSSGSLSSSNLTASRVVLSGADKTLVSASASGSVPIDADGSSTTSAQVQALFPSAILTNNNTTAVVLSNNVGVDVTHSLSLSNLTASRVVLTSAADALSSAAASGAVPIDADGSATTSAQIQAIFPSVIVTNGESQAITLSNNVTVDATHSLSGPINGATITNSGLTSAKLIGSDANGKQVVSTQLIGFTMGGFSTSETCISSTANYLRVMGTPSGAGATTEANASQALYQSGYFTNLWFNENSLGASTNITMTLMTNGVASNLAVTLLGTGAGPIAGSDVTHSVAFLGGSNNCSLRISANNPTVSVTLTLNWSVMFVTYP